MSRELEVPDVLMAWGRGWTISRGTPAPVAIAGGFRVDVGLPGHRVRHVLHTYAGNRLAQLGQELTAPGSWIKVAGDRATLRAALPPLWTIDNPGHLMATTISSVVVQVPTAYQAQTTVDGDVVVVTDGETAASAQMACSGEFAIFDKVVTEPAHRRRGLASVLMGLLTNHAADLGIPTGVLGATDDGRALYRALGWTVRSELSGAFIAEP